jgi:CheY-like chemotaxis protein
VTSVTIVPSILCYHPAKIQSVGVSIMNILVVDDNPGSMELLVGCLRMFGHKVDFAENGIEALYLLGDRKFDVVVTDGNMPMMSGYDLCRHIRTMYPDTYIIGISGSPSLNKFKEAGAHDFLRKPYNPFSFQDMIEARFSETTRAT